MKFESPVFLNKVSLELSPDPLFTDLLWLLLRDCGGVE